MPSNPKGPNTETIGVNVPKWRHSELKKLAGEQGITMSEYIRRLLFSAMDGNLRLVQEFKVQPVSQEELQATGYTAAEAEKQIQLNQDMEKTRQEASASKRPSSSKNTAVTNADLEKMRKEILAELQAQTSLTANSQEGSKNYITSNENVTEMVAEPASPFIANMARQQPDGLKLPSEPKAALIDIQQRYPALHNEFYQLARPGAKAGHPDQITEYFSNDWPYSVEELQIVLECYRLYHNELRS
ncbi:MAG: hypothetical protein AAFX93_13990 [Verrucomicrobiota bacterium]